MPVPTMVRGFSKNSLLLFHIGGIDWSNLFTYMSSGEPESLFFICLITGIQ
jgi:hypothetical protein